MSRADARGVTAGALLTLAGIAFLLDRLDVIDLPALVVWPAILAGTAVVLLVPRRRSVDTGGDVIAPRSRDELAPSYEVDAGRLTLDLRQLSSVGTPLHVAAVVGVGQLSVLVPSGLSVDVDAHVAAGSIDALGDQRDGTDLVVAHRSGAPTVDISLALEVGVGRLRVVAAPADAPTAG